MSRWRPSCPMPSPRCSTRAQRRASAVRGVRASIRCGPPCAGAGSHVPRLVHAGLAEELRLPELRWLKQDNDTVALDLLISAQLLVKKLSLVLSATATQLSRSSVARLPARLALVR